MRRMNEERGGRGWTRAGRDGSNAERNEKGKGRAV